MLLESTQLSGRLTSSARDTPRPRGEWFERPGISIERPRLPFVPELPEVQALAERLEARLAGAAFIRAEPLSFTGLKTVAPSPHALAGSRLRAVGRRGKFLIFELDRDTVR